MKKIVDFPYNDIVLFAKGWYERTDDVFADIKACLEEDNRSSVWDNMSKHDICHHMMNCLDKIYEYLDDNDKRNNVWLCKHSAFLEQIRHRMDFYEMSYEEAIVYTVLSVLCGMTKDQIELKKPVYGKGRRRIGGLLGTVPKSMTYREMNRMASKMFDDK